MSARPSSSDEHVISFSWLVRFRWALLGAQITGLVLSSKLRDIHMHAVPAAALVGLGIASNVACALWLRRRGAPREWMLGAVLALDVLLLTALLFQAGGYSNPLSFLYLVYVALGSVMLARRWPWALVVLSVAASASLMLHHAGHHAPAEGEAQDMELSRVDLAHAEHARLHVEGMWISFGVIAYFVTRVRRALAARDAELARERALVTRSERIASLATLAAGAAHELATPLSTVATVAKELERAAAGPVDPESVATDARLIRGEVDRCRAILHQMTADAGATAADRSRRMQVGELFDAALEEVLDRDRIRVVVEPEASSASFEAPPRALAQALRSALKNALEASAPAQEVVLRAAVEGSSLRIEIRDQGPGMSPEVLARAGEPFFTTKEPGRGMGLGLFLTRTVLERAGGTLVFDSAPRSGTVAVLSLPVALATNYRSPGGAAAG